MAQNQENNENGVKNFIFISQQGIDNKYIVDQLNIHYQNRQDVRFISTTPFLDTDNNLNNQQKQIYAINSAEDFVTIKNLGNAFFVVLVVDGEKYNYQQTVEFYMNCLSTWAFEFIGLLVTSKNVKKLENFKRSQDEAMTQLLMDLNNNVTNNDVTLNNVKRVYAASAINAKEKIEYLEDEEEDEEEKQKKINTIKTTMRQQAAKLIDELLDLKRKSFPTMFAAQTGFNYQEATKYFEEQRQKEIDECKQRYDEHNKQLTENQNSLNEQIEQINQSVQNLNNQYQTSSEKYNKIKENIKNNGRAFLTYLATLKGQTYDDFKEYRSTRKTIQLAKEIYEDVNQEKINTRQNLETAKQKQRKELEQASNKLYQEKCNYNLVLKQYTREKQLRYGEKNHVQFKQYLFNQFQNPMRSKTFNNQEVQDAPNDQTKNYKLNALLSNIEEQYKIEVIPNELYALSCAISAARNPNNEELLGVLKQENININSLAKFAETTVEIENINDLPRVFAVQSRHDVSKIKLQVKKSESVDDEDDYLANLFTAELTQLLFNEMRKRCMTFDFDDISLANIGDKIKLGLAIYDSPKRDKQKRDNMYKGIKLTFSSFEQSYQSQISHITDIYLSMVGKDLRVKFSNEYQSLRNLVVLSSDELVTLQVDAPNLRSLSVTNCVATVTTAAMLENLTAINSTLDIGGSWKMKIKRLHFENVKFQNNSPLFKDLNVLNAFQSLKYLYVSDSRNILPQKNELELQFENFEKLDYFELQDENVTINANMHFEENKMLELPAIIISGTISAQINENKLTDLARDNRGQLAEVNRNIEIKIKEAELDDLEAKYKAVSERSSELEKEVGQKNSIPEYFNNFKETLMTFLNKEGEKLTVKEDVKKETIEEMLNNFKKQFAYFIQDAEV